MRQVPPGVAGFGVGAGNPSIGRLTPPGGGEGEGDDREQNLPLLAVIGFKVVVLAGTSERTQHHGRSRPTFAEKRSSARVRERHLHEIGLTGVTAVDVRATVGVKPVSA